MSAEYDEDEGGNQLVEGEETHVNDSDLKLPTDVDLSAFNKRVATGEEDEDVLHKVTVKLYVMAGKEWKERAKGDAKFLKHRATGRVRLLVRQEKTLKVRANFQVSTDCKPQPGSDKSLLWTAMDVSDDTAAGPTMTTFAAKFANKDTADEFAKVWAAAKATNAEAPSAPAPAPAPAAHVDASGPVPVVDALGAIYGEDKAGEMAGRYAALADAFRAAHGREPTVFVRAPGRVNLIGEHVDYHGYSVLPMALQTQDVVVAVALEDSGAGGVRVSNAAPGWGDVAELPLDPAAKVDFEAGVKWWQYVQCGYKGAFEFAASKGRPAAPKPLRLTIDGRVPPGAGVSSSSALVVASFLAVAQALGVVAGTRMTKAELGEAARACELHIGTMSGGMDQAASAMGTAGAASRIDFEPLTATPVRLPAGAAFVVSNCMEPSPKAVDAEKRYNKRVTEGKLAAKLVAKGEGLPGWAAVATFRGLQEALGLRSPGALLPAIARHLRAGPYSLDDVAAAAGAEPETLFEGDGKRAGALKVIGSVAKGEPAFELLKRARHVCAEAERVFELQAACERGTGEAALRDAGALMTASHASCRDDYECSSPGLDALTTLALASGAYGSRLTGAGWGGCAVSLVPADKVDAFIAALVEGYYKPNGLLDAVPTAVFASAPGAGAAVYAPPAELDI